MKSLKEFARRIRELTRTHDIEQLHMAAGGHYMLTEQSIAWVLCHLSEEERKRLQEIEEEYLRRPENTPHWKDPAWESYDAENMRLLNQHGRIWNLGEARAQVEPPEVVQAFLKEYHRQARSGETDLNKKE